MTAVEEIRDAIERIREVRYKAPEQLTVRRPLYESAFWEIWLDAVEIGCVTEIGPPRLPDWYLLYGVKITPLAERQRHDR